MSLTIVRIWPDLLTQKKACCRSKDPRHRHRRVFQRRCNRLNVQWSVVNLLDLMLECYYCLAIPHILLNYQLTVFFSFFFLTADGPIGGTAQQVGGPFDKAGAIGKHFNADGTIGGTVQENLANKK